MPNVEDIVPQLPWEGPPLPEATKLKWPLTLKDVEKAVQKYAAQAPRAEHYYREAAALGKMGIRTPRDIPLATARFREGMERKVEHYRLRLLRALKTGRW